MALSHIKNDMKVSIIIPIYNVGPYIDRCLRSVANQTYSSIECILVDDCGTDDSMKICEGFLDNYKGEVDFKLFHHEHNKGLSAARNTGFLHASGEYVFFLDSDDELSINAIALLVAKAKEHPGIDMVQGNAISIPYNGYYDSSCFENHSYTTDNSWIRDNFYKTGKTIPVTAWNKLLKTAFLREQNLLFKEDIIHEDLHWMWFLVKHLQSMAFVFQITYIHHITPNSIMTSLTKERHAIAMNKILQDWICHVDNISYVNQLKKILILYRKNEITKYTKENNGKFILNVMKTLWKYNQYKSLAYMSLWTICLFYKDSKKLFRHVLENIGNNPKNFLSLHP